MKVIEGSADPLQASIDKIRRHYEQRVSDVPTFPSNRCNLEDDRPLPAYDYGELISWGANYASMIEKAKTSKDASKRLKLIIANMISRRDVLPPLLHDWLLNHLRKDYEDECNRFYQRLQYFQLNIIEEMIQILVNDGFSRSRNEATENKTSAIDLVIKALDLRQNYDALRKALDRKDKKRPYIE